MTPLQAAATTTRVTEALAALQEGRFVLLYDADGREEETDLIVASEFVNPATIEGLRTQAGGLICTTLHPRVHRALGLPYLSDVYSRAGNPGGLLARLVDAHIPYEQGRTRPSFGLSVNHRNAYTGVTDRDRALTIQALAALTQRVGQDPGWNLQDEFVQTFRAPGHVFLLNAHEKMLDARRGHTELATALVEMAGLAPSATICEMMGGPDGRALPKSHAVKYAAQHGLVFLEGHEVLDEWKKATQATTA